MEKVRAHIASTLKRLRKNAGMNVDEVGAKLGKSGKTISAWEVGRGQPDGDELIALCRLFDAHISEFFGEAIPVSEEDEFVDVPVYGSIAAGTPIEMIEVEETFPVARSIVEKFNGFDEDGLLVLFLLKIKGESMNRILPNGVYGLTKPSSTIDYDNAPYAVCVNGYDATVKRVHKLNNGFELVPDSTDPTFKPTVYDYGVEGTETITIIGRVVYYVLPFDWSF